MQILIAVEIPQLNDAETVGMSDVIMNEIKGVLLDVYKLNFNEFSIKEVKSDGNIKE